MDDWSRHNLPPHTSYDERRGLIAEGLVARNIAEHPVVRRADRDFGTCEMELADNTMLTMHLARIEPGGYKCKHRHLDETCGYVALGSGYGIYRQAEDVEPIRVDWKAGDLLVTPCNSWHQHFNASQTDYARQLSFRNVPVIDELVLGAKHKAKTGVPTSRDARFWERFADEPDYFTRRQEVAPGVIVTNYVSQIVDEALPPEDPELGRGVALQHYIMGGQRMLDLVLAGIRRGGYTRPRRSLAEEGVLVLAGEGWTDIWDDSGRRETIEWKAGDLISPPLFTWRSHHAASEVRLLVARNVALELALGGKVGTDSGLDSLPVRWPGEGRSAHP
jgi:gentisate 1,2-dioxygenase